MRNRIWHKLAILSAIFLTGCWDAGEVEKLFLPFAVALDVHAKDQEIKFSFLSPAFQERTSSEVVVLKGTGRSIADAAQNAQEKVHKEINMGQVQVLLVAEKIAQEKGIGAYLAYFARDPSAKGYTNLLICKGAAEDALDMKVEATAFISELINEAVKLNFPDDRSPGRILRNFLNTYYKQGIEPSLPYLETQYVDGEAVGINICKIAAFQGDRMVGVLGERETLGYKIVKGDAKWYLLTISNVEYLERQNNQNETKGFSTMRILKVKSKIKPQISGETPRFIVEVQVKGDIIEHNPSGSIKLFEDQYIEELEKKFQIEVKKLIDEMLEQIQKGYKTDIVGFGRTLRAYYPAYFHAESWKEEFTDVEIDVKVEVHIRTIGISG